MERTIRLIACWACWLLIGAFVGLVLLPVDAAAQSRERTTGREKTERVEKRSKKTADDRAKTDAQGRTGVRSQRRTERTTNAARDRDARRDRTVRRDPNPRPAPQDRTVRDRDPRPAPPGKHRRRDTRRDVYRGGRVFHTGRKGVYIHTAPRLKVRPVIHIDIEWPWVYRHRRGWAPRYEYRQVVYIGVGWGRQHRDSRIDVRTVYRHRVRYATGRYAEVDIYIDRIELYEDGYYLGEVDRIPAHLSRIRATIYRSGRVDFDRSVFLVGDPYAGFEMISTRYYDRYVLGGYYGGRDYRVGVLDLRRERVVPARYSRLFDPRDFNGYVPISLLPDDQGWLCDYGPDAVSYYRYDDDYDDDDYYYGYQSRDRNVRPSVRTAGYAAPMLQRERNTEFSLELGARVKLNRTVEIRRID